LACDMRLQGAKARIGFIQAKLAITSAWGGGPDLCQLVGAARAMRMMSRCELVDAQQALAWGLADAVIGEHAVEQDIQAFISPLLSCPPHVLRGIKAQTSAWRRGLPYDERRSTEQQHLLKTWLHEDHWKAAEKLLPEEKSGQ
jgi:enoyl-CoA hydratase